MEQSAIRMDDRDVTFAPRSVCELEFIERKRQAMRKEKREIERERRKLEREKREFFLNRDFENQRIEGERQLFAMKWKILEDELKKLACEKQQVEKLRKFYQCLNDHKEQEAKESAAKTVRGEMFFVGVEDKQALRKRYTDLVKIYHPDNVSGDVGTIQEINREYDRLQAQYT